MDRPPEPEPTKEEEKPEESFGFGMARVYGFVLLGVGLLVLGVDASKNGIGPERLLGKGGLFVGIAAVVLGIAFYLRWRRRRSAGPGAGPSTPGG